MALQQYDYVVVHFAGRVNENADALSRRYYSQEGEDSPHSPCLEQHACYPDQIQNKMSTELLPT